MLLFSTAVSCLSNGPEKITNSWCISQDAHFMNDRWPPTFKKCILHRWNLRSFLSFSALYNYIIFPLFCAQSYSYSFFVLLFCFFCTFLSILNDVLFPSHAWFSGIRKEISITICKTWNIKRFNAFFYF